MSEYRGLIALARALRPDDVDVQLADPVLTQQGRIFRQRAIAPLVDAHVGGDELAVTLQLAEPVQDALERLRAARHRDVSLVGGALDRDAPFEASEREHGFDESGLREHDAVGEDHDVLEAELDRLRECLEEALVRGGLAAEEREMPRPRGARGLERLDDGLERDGAGDLHRRQLTARAEDAAVVAEVAELDLELVSGARRRDRGGRATIFFSDARAQGHQPEDRSSS